MHLYEQLRASQQVPHAYEKWDEYRMHLTDYILKETSEKGSIALLGIGKGADIDLAYLVAQNRKLVLIDCDERAMQEACQHYDVMNHPSITCYVQDFVGISESVYRRFIDDLIQTLRIDGVHTSLPHYANYVTRYIKEIYVTYCKTNNQWVVPSCDYGVIIGVHSQLLNTFAWVWQIILETLQQEEDTVKQLIHELNQDLMPYINTELLKQIKKKVIVGLEVERVGRMGAVEGAFQAREDFDLRRQRGEVVLGTSKTLLWPFDTEAEIVYHMQFQSLFKKEAYDR